MASGKYTNPWALAIEEMGEQGKALLKTEIANKRVSDREKLLLERADITQQIQAINQGAPADSVKHLLSKRVGDDSWNQNAWNKIARIEGRNQARMMAIDSIQTSVDNIFKTEDIGRSNDKNIQDITKNIKAQITAKNMMLGDAASRDLRTELDSQNELYQVNRMMLQNYPDHIPDVEDPATGKVDPKTAGYQIDPNMQGGAKLQQTLDLLQSGGSPATARAALAGISTSKPEVVNRGDDIYTQVPTRAFDQLTTEQQEGLVSLQDKPGMQFLKNDRYKPIDKKDEKVHQEKSFDNEGTATVVTTFRLKKGNTAPVGATVLTDDTYSLETAKQAADPTARPNIFKYDEKSYKAVVKDTPNAIEGTAIGQPGQYFLEVDAPSGGGGKSRETLKWEKLAKHQNQSNKTYKMLAGTQDQRDKLTGKAGILKDLSILAEPTGNMDRDNSMVVQYHIGRELLTMAKWGESGLTPTDPVLNGYFAKDNYEAVADYFYDEGKKNSDGKYVLPNGDVTKHSLKTRFSNLDLDPSGLGEGNPEDFKLLMRTYAKDYAMHEDPENLAGMDLATADRSKEQLEDDVITRFNTLYNSDKNDRDKTKSHKLIAGMIKELRTKFDYTDDEIKDLKELGNLERK